MTSRPAQTIYRRGRELGVHLSCTSVSLMMPSRDRTCRYVLQIKRSLTRLHSTLQAESYQLRKYCCEVLHNTTKNRSLCFHFRGLTSVNLRMILIEIERSPDLTSRTETLPLRLCSRISSHFTAVLAARCKNLIWSPRVFIPPM